jgi:hypothetical protein
MRISTLAEVQLASLLDAASTNTLVSIGTSVRWIQGRGISEGPVGLQFQFRVRKSLTGDRSRI